MLLPVKINVSRFGKFCSRCSPIRLSVATITHHHSQQSLLVRPCDLAVIPREEPIWSLQPGLRASLTHTGHHLAGPHHEYRSMDCTDQPAISEIVRQRRLAMLRHVSRMSPSMDTYRTNYQHLPSDWRRRPGRPRQTWLATIRRDMWQLGIELDDVPELAADCVLWRGMTRGATHHPDQCTLLLMMMSRHYCQATDIDKALTEVLVLANMLFFHHQSFWLQCFVDVRWVTRMAAGS